jgi:acetolactate decarboxylase
VRCAGRAYCDRVPRRLSLSLPDAVHDELARLAAVEGTDVPHVARRLLGDALSIDHHSMFQVSTSAAIVSGVYDGCVTVADLRARGDFGLGTFDGLDGELVLLDGTCYQALGDSDVRVAEDDALVPFAAVTHFRTDATGSLTDVVDVETLCTAVDGMRGSDNLFVGIRVRGTFAHLALRAACRTAEHVPLVEATRSQHEWALDQVTGTLVGFWSPSYSRSVAVPGYHLHFVSDDRGQAGHVLGLSAQVLEVELHVIDDLHLALPETESFVHADLTGDPTAALDVAEHARDR